VTLASWYCGERIQSPLVILFHGYAVDKSGLMAQARTFLGLGASALLVDFRGSVGSSESYTTLGVREAEDVRAVVDYARSVLAHPSMILYGQSIGAAAILRAVSTQGVTADGVILEGVFDTLLNAVRNRFRATGVPAFPSAELLVFWGGRQAGVDAFELNPVTDAALLRAPALFLHGAKDRRATLVQARRVYAAVPGGKAFRVFDGAGHGPLVSQRPAEWRAEVADFLQQVASPGTRTE
jgi:pimeloyl-ACP methyl ester carboxylesterase